MTGYIEQIVCISNTCLDKVLTRSVYFLFDGTYTAISESASLAAVPLNVWTPLGLMIICADAF